jgi:putative alpha-1,2-mannosidase
LYSYTSEKRKREAKIREKRKTMYRAQPDGLAGNDDVGQMSSWYVLSALGFYPVNPADGNYVFGTPLFDSVTLDLDNGNSFTVKKQGDNGVNYVNDTVLNGDKLERNFIRYSELMKSGELLFTFK